MACLFKRNSGIYTIVYWARGKQKWLSTRTRDEAEARAIYESIRPSLDHPRLMTIRNLNERILEYARLNYKKGTHDLFRTSFKRLIAAVGNKPTRFVSPVDIETFKGCLIKEVSAVTSNDYLRSLKTAFNIGLRLNLVESNPFRQCRMFRVPPIQPVYLQKEEFARLLQSITDPCLARLIVFAALTGMRRGEIVNLHWADVDLNARLLHIQNSEGFTVKAMRPRTIPMNLDVFKLLSNTPKNAEYVFLDSSGKPYKAASVTNIFKRAARKCRLPEKIHLHSLRHSYASWLIQSSTPLAEVQKLLGHSSVVTTQIYAHLEHENLRETVTRVQLKEFAQKPSHDQPPLTRAKTRRKARLFAGS